MYTTKDQQFSAYKNSIDTDLTLYINDYASSDNHGDRALAVNAAIQKATKINDIKKILQNQIDLLEGKIPIENIEHLLDKRYSMQITHSSTLNIFSLDGIGVKIEKPLTYYDFIKKHYEITLEISSDFIPLFNLIGIR